jgi:hypothetical protein
VTLERAGEVTLITEAGLGCYLGKRIVADRDQLRPSHDSLYADVFSEGTPKVHGEGATQMNRVYSHLGGHALQRPYLLESIIKVVEQ